MRSSAALAIGALPRAKIGTGRRAFDLYRFKAKNAAHHSLWPVGETWYIMNNHSSTQISSGAVRTQMAYARSAPSNSSVRCRGPNGLLLRLSAEGRLELFQLLAVSASQHQSVKSVPRRL